MLNMFGSLSIGEIILTGFALGASIARYVLTGGHERTRPPRKPPGGNVVLVGFHLFNKGLQALALTTVDQMKRRFPDKHIYLLSSRDSHRPYEEKGIYTFSILPWDHSIKLAMLGVPDILLKGIRRYPKPKQTVNQIREVIRNSDYFMDISGYALSSQWGFAVSVSYLMNIIIASKFSVPFYALPQSIGPFNYSVLQKLLLYPLMKLYLPYPTRIFIREEEGMKSASRFTEKNLEKSDDVVLSYPGYKLDNIYTKEPNFDTRRIEPNSVGIIPNLRVLERTNRNSFYSMYCSLIQRLLDLEKNVYLFRHSYEDLGIIEEIKNFFPDNSSVRLLTDDMDAIELENLIKQFDFVIASRYHAIIHAYKNGIPAIAIGWSTKYSALLDSFNQLDYYFDVRNSLDTNDIISGLERMIDNCQQERRRIADKSTNLPKPNVFEILASKNR